jgi:hypothetical protein
MITLPKGALSTATQPEAKRAPRKKASPRKGPSAIKQRRSREGNGD